MMEPTLVVPLEKAWSKEAEKSGGKARWKDYEKKPEMEIKQAPQSNLPATIKDVRDIEKQGHEAVQHAADKLTETTQRIVNTPVSRRSFLRGTAAAVTHGKQILEAVKNLPPAKPLVEPPIQPKSEPFWMDFARNLRVNGDDMGSHYSTEEVDLPDDLEPLENDVTAPRGLDYPIRIHEDFKPQPGDVYIAHNLYDEGKAEGGSAVVAINNGRVRLVGESGSGPWGIGPGPHDLMFRDADGEFAKDMSEEEWARDTLAERSSWAERWADNWAEANPALIEKHTEAAKQYQLSSPARADAHTKIARMYNEALDAWEKGEYVQALELEFKAADEEDKAKEQFKHPKDWPKWW